jgi:hypothetical protein
MDPAVFATELAKYAVVRSVNFVAGSELPPPASSHSTTKRAKLTHASVTAASPFASSTVVASSTTMVDDDEHKKEEEDDRPFAAILGDHLRESGCSADDAARVVDECDAQRRRFVYDANLDVLEALAAEFDVVPPPWTWIDRAG